MRIGFATQYLYDYKPRPYVKEFDSWADAEQGWTLARENCVAPNLPFKIETVTYEENGQEVSCFLHDDFLEYDWDEVRKACIENLGRNGDHTACSLNA